MFQIKILSEDEIEKIAFTFRNKYCENKIPVNIEFIAEEKLKLNLIPFEGLRSKFKVEALLSSNLSDLYYELDTIEVRHRFSIAHEIGHLILHKELVKNNISKSGTTYFQENFNNKELSIIERQANKFASCLLVPKEELFKKIKKYKYLNYFKFYFPYFIKSILNNIFIIPKLAEEFKVSKEVIRINLLNLKKY